MFVIQQRNMYELINLTGTWYDTSNVPGMYELVKDQQRTQHGEAQHRTALRSAELALRCAAELSCRARQGIAGHGTARRLAPELYHCGGVLGGAELR